MKKHTLRKASWITKLAAVTVFLLTASVAFAAVSVFVGGKKMNLPDLDGYHIYTDKTAPPLSTLLSCLSLCGHNDASRAIAAYFRDEDVANGKIKNCIKSDGILISRDAMKLDKNADPARIFEAIKASVHSDDYKKMLFNETSRCGNLISAAFNEPYDLQSIEEVVNLAGPNYLIFVLRYQTHEQAGGEKKLSIRYEALAHVIINGELLVVGASDSRKNTNAQETAEFAVQFVKALTAANQG